ncbi:phage tail terminator protein [Pinisolibacter sp.]|uniref:phage tail terminator protein n=1 Tax=Pinisolibacter sp. TaxID=2172024 RepID=UPI002FDD6C2B
MLLAAVADRLKSAATPPLTSISGGEDLAALAEGTAPGDHAAFVLPFSKVASPNERMNGPPLQTLAITFLVAVCVRRHGDAKGEARIAATDAIDAALEGALLGWVPPGDHDPVTLVGVRSQPAKNGVLWHVSTWATARTIEGSS